MLSTHCHITFCDKSTGDSKNTLQALTGVCNHSMGHDHGPASRDCSNMEKLCLLELINDGIYNFPTGLWLLYLPVSLPVNSTGAFYLSFIDHLLLITVVPVNV